MKWFLFKLEYIKNIKATNPHIETLWLAIIVLKSFYELDWNMNWKKIVYTPKF